MAPVRWIALVSVFAACSGGNVGDLICAGEVCRPACDSIYESSGNQVIVSSALLPVDPTQSYRLSGRFRSTGAKRSVLYLGLATYDENDAEIESFSVYRHGSAKQVASASTTRLVVTSAITDWHASGDIGWSRLVGVYLDGNTDKRPDVVLGVNNNVASYVPTAGGYSQATSNFIALNQALGATLPKLTANTVVWNHTYGGTYVYSGAAGESVPAEWTTYESVLVTGEEMGGGYDTFRPGTRSVRIVVLANHDQDASHQLEMADIRLEHVSESGTVALFSLPADDADWPLLAGANTGPCNARARAAPLDR